ncbi:MAG: thermonuclease family protein [Pseudomonadota bacterium]
MTGIVVRTVLFLIGFIALAVIAAPFLGEWETASVEEQADRTVGSLEPAPNIDGPEIVVEDTPLAPVSDPSNLRDVTPDGVTPAPDVTGELTRLYVPPPPKPDVPPPQKTLFRVQVIDPATLKAGRDTIRLRGIEVPSQETACKLSNGNAVPCVRRGTTALQRLIRGRAVVCTYGEREDDLIPGDCSVANQDLAKWLVLYGWVTPSASAPDEIAELQDVAKREKRGIFAE